jgi:hypothetical protein
MIDQPGQKHAVPKCLSCGTITPWKIEPLLLPRHIFITLALVIFFGAGLVYALVVIAMRSNPNQRSKICPHCGGRNMWTFMY